MNETKRTWTVWRPDERASWLEVDVAVSDCSEYEGSYCCTHTGKTIEEFVNGILPLYLEGISGVKLEIFSHDAEYTHHHGLSFRHALLSEAEINEFVDLVKAAGKKVVVSFRDMTVHDGETCQYPEEIDALVARVIKTAKAFKKAMDALKKYHAPVVAPVARIPRRRRASPSP